MISKIKRAIAHPGQLALFLLHRTANLWPDRLFLKLKFRLVMGQKLDLKNPKTFNEKLQWLKLYNRKPEYTTMVDKYAVKQYVADKIGEQYIIPTLGVWDSVEDIDWDALPNQFVLKTTHGGGGGGVVICKDKATFDKEVAKKRLQKSLDSDIYRSFREWPYKDVPKRIIAEQYMTDGGADLEDYKVHNFNGTPRVILVCRDRFKDSPMIDDFYSTDWQLLDVRRPGHPNSPVAQAPPKELAEMLALSETLSKDIPFLRTDFYTIQGKVYFGELTFYPAAGMSKFDPEEWDEVFGKWLVINNLGGGKLLRHNNIYILLQIIRPSEEQLKDYKFFCFNGKVRCFKIDFDRFVNHKANYYDRDAKLLPFGEVACPPNFNREFEMPKNFDKMIEIVETLSQNIPFVRIDLYNADGQIYFGEITFFPAAGMGKFEPEKWDLQLGKLLDL